MGGLRRRLHNLLGFQPKRLRRRLRPPIPPRRSRCQQVLGIARIPATNSTDTLPLPQTKGGFGGRSERRRLAEGQPPVSERSPPSQAKLLRVGRLLAPGANVQIKACAFNSVRAQFTRFCWSQFGTRGFEGNRGAHSIANEQKQNSQPFRIGCFTCLGDLAGWTGLEPAASGVTGRRYNRLNYHPKFTSLGLPLISCLAAFRHWLLRLPSTSTLYRSSRFFFLWAGQGSNLRPSACKADALPLSYPPCRRGRGLYRTLSPGQELFSKNFIGLHLPASRT